MVPRGHAADVPGEEQRRAVADRGRGLVRDFAEDNPATMVSVLRFANVLGTHLITPISRTSPGRSARRSSASTPSCSSWRRTTSSVPRARHPSSIPGLYNVAGDGRLPWSEVAAICGTRLLPLSPVQPRSAAPWRGCSTSRGARGPAALRPGRRHPASPPRVLLQRHERRRGRSFIRAVRLRRSRGATPTSTRTSRTSSSSSATHRRSWAPATAEAQASHSAARFGSRAAHSSAVMA